jgi:serine/threonine-protein kinase HipA
MTPSTLLVRVSGVAAGLLTDHGSHTRFQLLDSYLGNPVRPILGQRFEDEPGRIWTFKTRIHPWFANVLPEGELRDFLASQLEVSDKRDAPLLEAIGADLPGAVTVERTDIGVVKSSEFEDANPVPHDNDPSGVRFSIAGYQLKLSMLMSGQKGLTLAGRGELGDHIVKLPSPGFPMVPENERSMMLWARAIGVNTPESFLVEAAELDLPEAFRALARGHAYAVKRFDRPSNGGRVHIEDLNQVVGQWPAEKYDGASYESLGRVIYGTTGSLDDLDEYVRRLVFIIGIGNEDAHLKNWSLVYSDRRNPRLSPAYDLVSTITYEGLVRGLGLSIGRTKTFRQINRSTLIRLARKVDVDESRLAAVIDETVAKMASTIDEFGPMLGPREQPLRDHFSSVPLFNE